MKRIQMVKVGNAKKLCLTELIVLTKVMSDKFNCEGLLQKIDSVAKDLHVEWAVELNGQKETLAVSRVSDEDVVNEEILHKLEADALTFFSTVQDMEMPEPEYPSHESDKIEKLEFVKALLNDINLPSDNDRHVLDALIIDTTTTPFFPELTGWGHMSHDLLKEMCELYIKEHSK